MLENIHHILYYHSNNIEITLLYLFLFISWNKQNYLLRLGFFYMFFFNVVGLINQSFYIKGGFFIAIQPFLFAYLIFQKLYYIDKLPRDKINKNNIILISRRNWSFTSYLECLIGGDNAFTGCLLGDEKYQYQRAVHNKKKVFKYFILSRLFKKYKDTYKNILYENRFKYYPLPHIYNKKDIHKYYYIFDTKIPISIITPEIKEKVKNQHHRQWGTFGLSLNCNRSLRPIYEAIGGIYKYKYFRGWFLPSIYWRHLMRNLKK